MAFTYFAIFYGTAALADGDRARVLEVVRTTPRLVSANIYTPEQTRDPYLDDGPPPPLALQLYFAHIADLEVALAERGHLQALAAPGALPSLAGARVEQQAMLARGFAVPDPAFRTQAGALPCTYLVYYPGTADDLNQWLTYYIAHHPPLMARFPDIRAIEICTRIDWCGCLPWPRVEHMQRNKVVFDSAAALTAALNSPVRHDMRADFHKFPPFHGGSLHHPMATEIVTP